MDGGWAAEYINFAHESRHLSAGLHAQEIDLRFVLGYSPLEFRDTLHMLAEGRVDARPLITATVGLDGVAAAFDALAHPGSHARILIDPRSSLREPAPPATVPTA